MSCVLLLVVDSKKKEKWPHKLFTTKFVDVLNNRGHDSLKDTLAQSFPGSQNYSSTKVTGGPNNSNLSLISFILEEILRALLMLSRAS